METYLMHYGVKGMKWGVRRYQNYDGTLTELGKKQAKYNRAVRIAKANGHAKVKDLEDYTVGLTTITTKYGSQYVSGLTHGHDFDWQENITKRGDATNYSPVAFRNDWHYNDGESGAPSSHGAINDDYLKWVNEDWGAPGTKMNCAKNSACLELALRGYKFRAGRQSYPSAGDSDEFWFKGAKPVEYDENSCERSLRSYGKKTSGTISIRYKGSDIGHKMHWTNDDFGNFTIEDGQNGRKFKSLKEMTDAYNADVSKGFRTYRLDNCEPNWDNMASDSVCRLKDQDLNESFDANVWNRIEKRRVDTW